MDFLNLFTPTEQTLIKAQMGVSEETLFKARILSHFPEYAAEQLLDPIQKAFEDSIKKAEVDVLTADDVRDTYGGKWYDGAMVRQFSTLTDILLKKGENVETPLSDEEFGVLEKALQDLGRLERKAVALPAAKGTVYREIYVEKKIK